MPLGVQRSVSPLNRLADSSIAALLARSTRPGDDAAKSMQNGPLGIELNFRAVRLTLLLLALAPPAAIVPALAPSRIAPGRVTAPARRAALL
jgi:hypothetical protein